LWPGWGLRTGRDGGGIPTHGGIDRKREYLGVGRLKSIDAN
jgi:hypothetical protein